MEPPVVERCSCAVKLENSKKIMKPRTLAILVWLLILLLSAAAGAVIWMRPWNLPPAIENMSFGLFVAGAIAFFRLQDLTKPEK